MRTVDATLTAALASGTGIPYIRLIPSGMSFLTTPFITAYRSDRFTLEIFGNNLDDLNTIGGASRFRLRRGLTIAGVDYFVSSPFWYIYSIHPDYRTGNWSIKFLAWESHRYNKSTDGDQTAEQVITDLLSDGCTPSFLSQAWTGYQYEKAGTTVKPGKFESMLVTLFNKYTVKMFPRDDGDTLFLSKITGTELSPTAVSWNVNTSHENRRWYESDWSGGTTYTRSPHWNIFSEDETGATHRLSATYPDLLEFPIRNVGFLPSTASASYIKTLLSDPAYRYNATPEQFTLHEYAMRPNFEIEHGEYLDTSEGVMLASVSEFYNISGQPYPWTMKVKGEQMFYDRS